MSRFARPLAWLALVLLVPIVPFILAGDRLEAWSLDWLHPDLPGWQIAAFTVALLASDIFLPVPSSVVGTWAGAQLGIVPATLAAWLGLTLGGIAGFALARRFGRPLAERFCSPADRAACDRAGHRLGAWLVAVSRPLPVLAEATVLFLGTTELAWSRFLPALALSNLALSAVYATLGRLAWQQGELPLALIASIGLPVAATALARWVLGRHAPLSAPCPADAPPPGES